MILNVGKKATQVLFSILAATTFSACGKTADAQQARVLAAPTQPRAQQLQQLSARVSSASPFLSTLLLHTKASLTNPGLTSAFHVDPTLNSEQLIGMMSADERNELYATALTRSGEQVECSGRLQTGSFATTNTSNLILSCRSMNIALRLNRQPLAPERVAQQQTLQALKAQATLTLQQQLETIEVTLLSDQLVVHAGKKSTRYLISGQERQRLLTSSSKIVLKKDSASCAQNQCDFNTDAQSLQLTSSGELLLEMASSSASNPKIFTYSPHRSMRVASYNVENFWDDDARNSSAYDDYSDQFSNWHSGRFAEKKARRIRAALINAGLPEVVGFQEIESAANRSRSLELLKPILSELGYNHYALGQQAEDNPTAVTTAVISKFPIAENTRLDFLFKPEELKPEEQKDFMSSSRDPQRVSVILPEGTVFTLLNSHWKSKRDKSPWGDVMRRALAEMMGEHVEALRTAEGSPAHAIIVGDFNADYREEPVRAGLRLAQSLAEARSEQSPQRLVPLWLTLSAPEQGDYPHDSHFQALDNIIVTRSLLNEGSLTLGAALQVVGRSGYAAKTLSNGDGLPMRSQLRKYKDESGQMRTTHFDLGFSDHLPLVAHFNRNTEGLSAGRQALFPANIETQTLSTLPQVEISGASCAEQGEIPIANNISNLQQGDCVEYSQVAFEMQKTGLHNIYVQLNSNTKNAQTSEKVVITADRAFGANKGWLRGKLQSSAGKTLKYVRGRVGYVEGYKAIFIHSPSTDIVFE
jgi:endonuclease/exonuclease/phosphatase family metal-dependent hydrolase